MLDATPEPEGSRQLRSEPFDVRPIAVAYDDATELIAELDADLAVRYGSDDDPVLAHPDEFEPLYGRFFVVTEDGTCVVRADSIYC